MESIKAKALNVMAALGPERTLDLTWFLEPAPGADEEDHVFNLTDLHGKLIKANASLLQGDFDQKYPVIEPDPSSLVAAPMDTATEAQYMRELMWAADYAKDHPETAAPANIVRPQPSKSKPFDKPEKPVTQSSKRKGEGEEITEEEPTPPKKRTFFDQGKSKDKGKSKAVPSAPRPSVSYEEEIDELAEGEEELDHDEGVFSSRCRSPRKAKAPKASKANKLVKKSVQKSSSRSQLSEVPVSSSDEQSKGSMRKDITRITDGPQHLLECGRCRSAGSASTTLSLLCV